MLRDSKPVIAFVFVFLYYVLCLSACALDISAPEEPTPTVVAAPVQSTAPMPTPTSAPTLEPPYGPLMIPEHITLSMDEHPELDFGYTQTGDRVICDFSFTNEGTLLLLQLSEKIYEYSFDGKLLGVYDLQLKDNGLTASRIAAGADGRLYLVDGRNNAIITATRAEIGNVAFVGVQNDVGLFWRFYCTGDELVATYFDADEVGDNITAVLDVDGDEVAIHSKWIGTRLSDNISFVSTAIASGSSRASNSIKLSIYKENVLFEEYIITALTDGAVIYGLEMLGVHEGDYWGKIYEYLPDDQYGSYTSYAETFIYLDPETISIQSCSPAVDSGGEIRYFGDKCYIFSRTDSAVTISDLFSACEHWETAEMYELEAVG